MKIVIIEDDYLQLDLIVNAIQQNLRIKNVKIIQTESEFHNKLKNFEDSPPDLFIIDVMLRWIDLTPTLTEDQIPENITKEGAYKAGFRCNQLISENKILSKIPRIIYSVVEKNDLLPYYDFKDKNVYYLLKDRDYEPLTDLIITLTK